MNSTAAILKSQINPVLVGQCLDASRLVYRKSPGAALKKVGLELVELYDVNGTQALIAATDDAFIIDLRGTDDLASVYTDLKFVKTDFPGGGRVHSGAYEYYKQVEEPLARTLETLDARPRIVAGHSLGWSAVMAGVTFKASAGYAFGGMRIGNQAFCDVVDFPVWRFEHRTDPVTYLPPRVPVVGAIWALINGRRPTFYNHPGVSIPLDGNLHRLTHYRKSVTKYLKGV